MRFVLSIIAALSMFLATPSYAASSHCAAIHNNALSLICHAEARNLPVNSTWGDVLEHDREISRREQAQARNLSITATWDDILEHDWEIRRQQLAKKYNMPETSSWDDIIQHAK
jgi:hypothetical protein